MYDSLILYMTNFLLSRIIIGFEMCPRGTVNFSDVTMDKKSREGKLYKYFPSCNQSDTRNLNLK